MGMGEPATSLLAAVALAVRERIRLSRAEQVFVGLLAAFTAWILLSAIWSVAPAESVLETQRALVYVAGVLAALVVSRSRYVWEFLGGVLAAISAIAVFSLATRVLPDRVGAYDSSDIYRLAQPIGYWNGSPSTPASARCSRCALRLAGAHRLPGAPARPCWSSCCRRCTSPTAEPPGLRLIRSRGCPRGRSAPPATRSGAAGRRPGTSARGFGRLRQQGLTHSGASFGSAVHDGHRLALVLLALRRSERCDRSRIRVRGTARAARAAGEASLCGIPRARSRRRSDLGLCPLRRSGQARRQGLSSVQGPTIAGGGRPQPPPSEFLRERA